MLCLHSHIKNTNTKRDENDDLNARLGIVIFSDGHCYILRELQKTEPVLAIRHMQDKMQGQLFPPLGISITLSPHFEE